MGAPSQGVTLTSAVAHEPALNCALQAYEKMTEFLLPLALQQPQTFGLPSQGVPSPYSLEHQDETRSHGMTRYANN